MPQRKKIKSNRQKQDPKRSASIKAQPKPGMRIYQIGNSWTAQSLAMHLIAQARGYDSTNKRFTIPGAGLSWLLRNRVYIGQTKISTEFAKTHVAIIDEKLFILIQDTIISRKRKRDD